MSEALQSAQQAMQNAGQQQAQGQKGEQGEASQEDMGQEFGSQGQGQGGQKQSGGQKGQGQGQGGSAGQGGKTGKGAGQSAGSGSGGGMGGPGRGAGGGTGPQQPLPGPKKDLLMPYKMGQGKKLIRSFKGTPDPNRDRAAYVDIVPEKLRAAESSLNREEIPAGHRKQVRDYFDAIQPGAK